LTAQFDKAHDTPCFAWGGRMSQNDILHLEAHFSNWKTGRGAGLVETDPFLYYALEQLLKPYNLEDEEIRYGIVDQGNDGGIDALYLFANHKNLIRDDADLRSSGTSRIHIVIAQIKSSLSETGFKLDDIRKLHSFVDDLLDLGTPAESYKHKYHQHLITLMNTFKDKYRSIMDHFPELAVDFHLVTRGDETGLDGAAEEEVDKLVAKVKSLIGHSQGTFYPTNTQVLLEHVRKRKQTTKTIKWSNPPVQTSDGYIGLVRLTDYFEFLRDEDDELNETIFKSNVRGYQGSTSINNAMAATLSSGGPLNFWLLNNGITVISGGRVQPITVTEINIEDPQIVNGLQTSRKIFDYVAARRSVKDDRAVLVKVLPVADAQHRRSIIRATNSQNSMNSATLLATDDVHYQIEDLFKRHNLYYDRRPGFYRDQDAPAALIVSVTELVQAVVALIEARPDTARARPSDYINKTTEYQKIFGRNRIPLAAYYKAIVIIRTIGEFLRRRRIVDKGIQRNYKYYIAYVLSVRLTRKLYFNPDELLQIDNTLLTDTAIESAFVTVNRPYGVLLLEETADGVAKGTRLLAILKENLGKEGVETAAPSPRRLSRKLKPRDVIKELERL
jgi:AIPR protein